MFLKDEPRADSDVVDGCEGGVRWDTSERHTDERREGAKRALDLELALVFAFI